MYVEHVDDKCTHARDRVRTDYNIYGFPTTWFDGGYSVAVGAYTDTTTQQTWYESLITSTGNRTVNDIDIALTAEWVGDASMDIDVSVTNNEASAYGGHIRVYVTETVSSMGWKDTWSPPRPYTHTFLDYAFDQDISVSAGGTWNGSTTWVGYDHNDGYGNDYGIITPNNVTIVAAVFDDTWHQGYSRPPNQNPFDAYWADEAAQTTPTISELIVDDEHSQFMVYKGSAWNTRSISGAWNGLTHWRPAGTGANWVAWRVDQIIEPGSYDVYAWKFEHAYSSFMATNAQYVVKDKYGTSGWIYKDQSTSGDEWLYLGSFDFDNSNAQGVALTDKANGFVLADAIKFVKTGK